MDSKICVVCNIEKSIDNFYNKYRERKPCNIKRSTKRYYENKDKISNQQKIYHEKNRDKLLQKQNDYNKKRSTDYKELQKKIKSFGTKIRYKTLKYTYKCMYTQL